MKARDIIGRKVVAIQQARRVSNYGAVFYELESITLDTGTLIFFTTTDTDDENLVTTRTIKRRK